jgi:hypothetical protein
MLYARVAAICWAIWKTRNRSFLEKKHIKNPIEILYTPLNKKKETAAPIPQNGHTLLQFNAVPLRAKNLQFPQQVKRNHPPPCRAAQCTVGGQWRLSLVGFIPLRDSLASSQTPPVH